MIDYTGRYVFPRGGDGTEAPSLAAIAVGLGRTPRFRGQTRIFYTVLSHTFVVAQLVEPQNRLHALLHDAPEAVVGDTPTTWKRNEQRADEFVILHRIYQEHGWLMPNEDSLADVKRADLACLAAEAHVLGHTRAEEYWKTTGDELEYRARLLTKHSSFFDGRYPFQPEIAAKRYLEAIHGAAPSQIDTAA